MLVFKFSRYAQLNVVLTILILCLALNSAFGTDPDFSLERSVTIARTIGGGIEARVELGELPPQSEGVIKLSLVNPIDDDFTFKSVDTGCGCLKVKCLGNKIPALGKLDVEVKLSTPSVVKDVNQRIGFFLKASEGYGVTVRIAYAVAGALSFPEQYHVTTSEFGANDHTFHIPIVFSEPVVPKNLEISGQDGFEQIKTEIVEKNGLYFVQCMMSLNGLKEDGRRGSLKVKDRRTERETTIRCMIEAPGLVIVAPSVVRFRLDSEDVKNASHIGSVIIRVHPSMLSSKEEEPVIEFASDVWKLKTDHKRLAPGVYRISIHVSPPELKSQPSTTSPPPSRVLTWSVTTKKASSSGQLEVDM